MVNKLALMGLVPALAMPGYDPGMGRHPRGAPLLPVFENGLFIAS